MLPLATSAQEAPFRRRCFGLQGLCTNTIIDREPQKPTLLVPAHRAFCAAQIFPCPPAMYDCGHHRHSPMCLIPTAGESVRLRTTGEWARITEPHPGSWTWMRRRAPSVSGNNGCSVRSSVMSYFRCYLLNASDKIVSVDSLEAEGDAAAMEMAGQLILANHKQFAAIEVWDRARRVGKIASPTRKPNLDSILKIS